MFPCFLVSFLPSKTIFILCITLDWRLQASVYCHWISDVVCFATCNFNVSSHTRKGPRLGKFSCIFRFALLNNRVLINGALRSWLIFSSLASSIWVYSACIHPFSSSLMWVVCRGGWVSTFVFFLFHLLSILFLTFVSCFFCYEENSTSFSLIRQTESKDTHTPAHGLADMSLKHSFKH